MTVPAVGGDTPGLHAVVNRVAGLLAGRGAMLSTGDVAAIRRMDPRSPAAPFFKLAVLALEDPFPSDSRAAEELEMRWATVVTGLALLGDLHQPGARLGRSLVAAGYSELRFGRLLRADADRLVDELPTLARFLAAKGAPTDWSTAALLILSVGRADEEGARRRIAREYYTALAHQEN